MTRGERNREGEEGEEEPVVHRACAPYNDDDAAVRHGTTPSPLLRFATAPSVPSSSPTGPITEELIDAQDYQDHQEDHGENPVQVDAGSDPKFDPNDDGWYD
ncbi:hypothetical protein C2845_PM08G21200 [Panicum miliaceum]|uniref:Uncharacterized protein n=1 Tax=Panicum miliaceum TaxID=4540 RepID=A0A3L6R0Q9_PANMI|nr:hypothetical protein C2845_PM08G21200 [Panicum miliaceum]